MGRDELVEQLLRYVADELLDGDDQDLDEHTPLLEWGVIDSMSMVGMLSFIEGELGITVPDEHVRPEHFTTVAALVALLVRLTDHRSVA